jgi:subtilisin-like proprotein convertase family protein
MKTTSVNNFIFDTIGAPMRTATIAPRHEPQIRPLMRNIGTLVLLMLLGVVTPSLLQAQTTETYTFTTNRLAPDGNPSGLSDTRTLNSAIGNIASVTVHLNMTGNFNGDLYGYLRHSSGFTVLLNRPGKTASSTAGYSDSGLDVTFQNGAANGDIHLYENVTTPSAGSPLTGTWQPDGRDMDPTNVTDVSPRSTSLTNFNGLNASGQWTLYLADLQSGGTNELTEWSLTIVGESYPTLSWANPTNVAYGTALGASQLNATATYDSTNVPGTFTYTPAADTVLEAGLDQTLSVTFTPSNTAIFLPISTNVTINVTAAPLTITANNASKVYGAALPTFTASYSGFVNGDTAASLTTPVTLGTTATASSAIGAYTVTASGAVDANYSITEVNGSLNVTTAPLIITANNKSKVYGASLPTFTASYSGFVNGDTAANLTAPVTLGTTATAASPVGAYTITASGAVDANYSITEVNGSLSVTAVPLTITANNKSKVYGAALPTFTASYSGFVNGDTAASLSTPVTLSTTATAASPVGAYTITANGAVDANYTITEVNGSLSVTAAPLTITANNATKVYGAALPTFTASYSGFVNGDTAASLTTPVTLGTTATASSPVGAYTITASGAVDANYTITEVNGSLNVTAAPLTITANNATKAYGAALPTFTASYSGFVNGDTASSLTTPVTLGTTATASSPVGAYTITASGAVDANYTITEVNGSLNVTAAPLTITANNATKVYGAALPSFTASYSGFVNGDTASSLTTPVTLGTTAIASSPVGAYTITASGAVDANYSISFVAGTLTISQSTTTGMIVSSANPALPGANVTFTMTVSPVAPGAGTPAGQVVFIIDGSMAGTATLSGGVAAFATNSLPHGSNTVVAQYAGNLNFVGITNTLAPVQIIDTPPVASNVTIERYPTMSVKVSIATLLTNTSAAEGDTLTVAVSSTSSNGAAITVTNGWVFYTPASGFTNADSFTYTVTDNFGESAVGTVFVVIEVDNSQGENLAITNLGNGSYLIVGNGIPGRTYRLESTPSLSPADWQIIVGGSVTAGSTGSFQYTNTPSGGTNFYRTVFP